MEEANIGYDKVIFLDVSREEILKRLLARGRADDTEEIINNRIDLYNRETGPAVEYFRGKPGFVEIKAEGGTIEDNANKIIKAIEDGN
jgi:adenylate kinase